MGTLSGYVSNDYIIYDAAGGETAVPEEEPEAPDTGSGRVAIVLPESGLNLRTQPSRSSAVIMTLPQGTMLSVTGDERGGMTPVSLGGLDGYVATEYVFVATHEQLNPVTPTPAPTAAPVPTAVPHQTAIVTANSGLKLRTQPNTGSHTLTTMLAGERVTVTGDAVSGFYPVRYGELEGYASAAYLRLENQALIPAPTPVPTSAPTAVPTQVPQASQIVAGRTASVTAQSGVNLRADSSTYSDVVATLGYGVDVIVTGNMVSGFYPVRVGTLSGYVSADYLRFGETVSQQAPTPVPTQKPAENAYRVVVSSDNGLNLRAAPRTSSDVVYILPYGMVLTVIGESENGFLHVQWANYTGYVSSQYVSPLGAQ